MALLYYMEVLTVFPNTITLYHESDGQYTRHVITNCFYYDTKQATLNKTGIQNTDTMRVIIDTATDIDIHEGYDIVVKGECDIEIDNTSESTVATSLKALKKAVETWTVSSKSTNLYGGLPNIDLSCK